MSSDTVAPTTVPETLSVWFRKEIPLHPRYREETLTQYRTLGRTGIKVSPYALGTLMFATQVGNPDPEDSIRVIHKALDAGINFIDTSDAYGDSEEIVGRALESRRDTVVLATKFSRPTGTDPNQQGVSRRWIMTAVENSLRRLQTDHIDLYQVHRLDPDTDIEETLSALTDLIRTGRVQAIGSSNTPAGDIVEAQWVAERRGPARPGDAHRPRPQGSAKRPAPGTHLQAPQRRAPDRRRRTTHPARRRGRPAIDPPRHGLRHRAPGVTSAVLGPRTMEHLDNLLAGVGVTLTDETLDRIDEIVPPGTDVTRLDQAYLPPPLLNPSLRRRPVNERGAA